MKKPLSEEEQRARRPLPVEVLASPEEYFVHEVKGKGRSVRNLRKRRNSRDQRQKRKQAGAIP